MSPTEEVPVRHPRRQLITYKVRTDKIMSRLSAVHKRGYRFIRVDAVMYSGIPLK